MGSYLAPFHIPSHSSSKFTNKLMRNGKKSVAERRTPGELEDQFNLARPGRTGLHCGTGASKGWTGAP